MAQQVEIGSENVAVNAEYDASRDDGTHEVLPDLAYKRLAIVNVAFYGVANAGDGNWVLIDAGVPGPGVASAITGAAEARFGKGAKPAAIILTHAHFDHVGALSTLAEQWDVPIYAHELEIPYLNGSASYPPPDPTVGGGMMALMSPLYPRGPFDVSRWLRVLPSDGEVPFMPGWQWIFAPGHTPGQVALWREADRTLLPADAFITTAQESAYAVAVQKPELHGPPMYYTQNWQQSRETVQRLAALEPELVVSGHGQAMQGHEMRLALHALAENFNAVAKPDQGKYVENPTSAADGSAYPAP